MLELLLPVVVLLAAGALVLELLLGAVLLGAGGVVLGLLRDCELPGVRPPFGLVVLVGLEPLFGAVRFGVALGFKLPGVTPPPGVAGVPGASGGVTPGGDEFDGGAVLGDLLVDGATTVGDDDCEDGGDELEGAAGVVCAWAPVAAAKPRAAAATTVCNWFMTMTS